MNEYEKQRAERIKANAEKMKVGGALHALAGAWELRCDRCKRGLAAARPARTPQLAAPL